MHGGKKDYPGIWNSPSFANWSSLKYLYEACGYRKMWGSVMLLPCGNSYNSVLERGRFASLSVNNWKQRGNLGDDLGFETLRMGLIRGFDEAKME